MIRDDLNVKHSLRLNRQSTLRSQTRGEHMHGPQSGLDRVLISDRLNVLSMSLRVLAMAVKSLARDMGDDDCRAISDLMIDACEELESIASDELLTSVNDRVDSLERRIQEQCPSFHSSSGHS